MKHEITTVNTKLVQDSLKKHHTVMIGNSKAKCHNRRIPVQKAGKWGVLSFDKFQPFSHAEVIQFRGRVVCTKYYINYSTLSKN